MAKLIESCLSPDSACRVVLVISNREDAKGLEVARSYGIETLVVPFSSKIHQKHFEDFVAAVSLELSFFYSDSFFFKDTGLFFELFSNFLISFF